MTIYSLLVFLHVLGAMGIFVALAIEAVALGGLRRAHGPADARMWMGLLRTVARIGPTAMLTTLGAGIWMMVQWWGPRPWIQTALAAVVAMMVLGGAVTGRRMRRIGKALPAETGPDLSPTFHALRWDGTLVLSHVLRVAIGTGTLGLMTLKPGISGSLVVMTVAVAAGLLASVQLGARRAPALETGPATEA